MSTKEEERKALQEIQAIVDSLGEDSYVAAAFKGCFKIAEENITNDFLNSPIDYAEKKRLEQQIGKLVVQCESERTIWKEKYDKLERELEKEQEWVFCSTCGTKMTQDAYMDLMNCNFTEVLSEEQAKQFLHDECGFSEDMVKIHGEAETYEVNRHHQLRINKKIPRKPLYGSSDWNYIRFSCGGIDYEYVNGSLYMHVG